MKWILRCMFPMDRFNKWTFYKSEQSIMTRSWVWNLSISRTRIVVCYILHMFVLAPYEHLIYYKNMIESPIWLVILVLSQFLCGFLGRGRDNSILVALVCLNWIIIQVIRVVLIKRCLTNTNEKVNSMTNQKKGNLSAWSVRKQKPPSSDWCKFCIWLVETLAQNF